MADKSTFIKLDRNIQNWRWYQNPNTFRVFIHCLLNANIMPKEFEGITINRGEFPTSHEKIGNTLNLTIQQVRTAINHLKSTGEITTKIYSKFQVITIVNYAYYQDTSTGKSTGNQQAFNIQLTVNQQQYKNNKNNKECKEEKSPAGEPPCGEDELTIDFPLSKSDVLF
jgi:biotin operon repressor